MRIWTEQGGQVVEPATMAPDGLHREGVRDFLTHVGFDDGTSHRGWQALARAEIVDACYASAESHREVPLG